MFEQRMVGKNAPSLTLMVGKNAPKPKVMRTPNLAYGLVFTKIFLEKVVLS